MKYSKDTFKNKDIVIHNIVGTIHNIVRKLKYIVMFAPNKVRTIHNCKVAVFRKNIVSLCFEISSKIIILMDIQQVKQRFGIVGNTYGINRAIDIAVQVAPTDLSVLIVGESGVGKESFPRIIHQYSPRKHKEYVAVNCGAIPQGTIASELFGHEKNSFTDARSDRKGYFEQADGGTIFLDEVGELPLSVQVQLLRVLETGEFMRVGASVIKKTNVRVVAATNLNMIKAVHEGRFREDLYYRLNTVPIHIPPLRERANDIQLLFRKFANDFAERYRMPSITLTPQAEDYLLSYRWPGNIRQLKNVAEQISVIEKERIITVEKLHEYIPLADLELLPVIIPHTNQQDLDQEKKMLYQTLFDIKKEMDELRSLIGISNISNNNNVTPIYNIRPEQNVQIEDTEDYIEESLSLGDQELDLIKKALEKHNGKRKYAAQDLGISERTLYRKIKDYNLL